MTKPTMNKIKKTWQPGKILAAHSKDQIFLQINQKMNKNKHGQRIWTNFIKGNIIALKYENSSLLKIWEMPNKGAPK